MKLKYEVRKYIIKHNRIMLIVNFLYRLIYKKKFKRRIVENLKSSIFDYKTLVKDIPYYPTDVVIDNNLYGLASVLKSYCGFELKKNLDAYIEHGVFFGSFVRWDQYIWDVSYNITFGRQRCIHLANKKINKDVLPIGPYIHYAKNILANNEYKKMKEKYGKILLVFPTHSDPDTNSLFDIDTFIDEVERIRLNQFDSVFISLYWLDIIDGKYMSDYERMGYKIVTSGHKFDVNFLNRQKTLIELADSTMSNNAGTHVGYCIYLNKPHYIFNQQVTLETYGEGSNNLSDFFSDEDNRLFDIETNEINKNFGIYRNFISEQDRRIIDKYWGTSFVRSPNELKTILSNI